MSQIQKNNNMPTISWLFQFTLLNRKPKSFNQAKQIHALLITTGLKTPIVLAKLIDNIFHFSPQNAPKYAHRLINQEHPYGKTFLFNTLIKCSQPRKSIRLFANWVSRNPSLYDVHTFLFALGACARRRSVSSFYEGMQIHCRVVKNGLVFDLQFATTLVHFYGSNGGMVYAKKVFDEMPERSFVTWNSLISAYSSQKMDQDENAYKAVVAFKEMLRCGFETNGSSLVSILPAVAQLGSLEAGRCVHGYVVKTVDMPENDVYVGTALVDMYCKCGCVDVAYGFFEKMKVKNVHTWTALTNGFAFHGEVEKALELLNEMKRHSVKPNDVTLTTVLSACCHAGLVEAGLRFFHSMETEFGVVPRIEHYGCVVDLLGRAGHLREAYDFIVMMPIKPDPILWRSLLGSCRLHEDTEMGEKVGRILLRAQPLLPLEDRRAPSEDYIGLANVYALAGRWQDVGMVRDEMEIKGLQIKPGRSAVC